MAQRMVALTGSAVRTSDAISLGSHVQHLRCPKVGNICIEHSSLFYQFSNLGGGLVGRGVEVLNMALMEDIRVGLAFPDLRQACSVCPISCCTSLILE